MRWADFGSYSLLRFMVDESTIGALDAFDEHLT